MPVFALANTSSGFMPQVKTPAFGSPRRIAFSFASSAAGGVAAEPPPLLLLLPLPPFLAQAIWGAVSPREIASANRMNLGLLMKASVGARRGAKSAAEVNTEISVASLARMGKGQRAN